MTLSTVKNSCKGCTERYQGCHSNCEKYKAFRKEIDEATKIRLKKLQEDRPFFELKRNAIEKFRRKHG